MSFGLLSVGFEMFESRMVWCGVVLVLFYVNHKLGDLPSWALDAIISIEYCSLDGGGV